MLGKVGQFQTQRENYTLIVLQPWSNKFTPKQETKTKMDIPMKMHSKQSCRQNHTFVRLGKLPAENLNCWFCFANNGRPSVHCQKVCLCHLFGQVALAVLPHRRLFLDHDFRLRGKSLTTPFGLLSYVAVQKAAANQQKQTK